MAKYNVLRLSLILIMLAPVALADAAEQDQKIFTDAAEAKTWQWLLNRAQRRQHVERDRKGALKWVGFYDEQKKRGDYYSGSLTLEQGRVVKMTFNAAHFKNEDFKRLASFRKLKILTAWHNGWDKTQKDKTVYSGAGLVHLNETEVASINFGGSFFSDEGVRTAVQLPTLKQLIIYHTRVTDDGLKALKDDGHIELLRVGPQYSLKISEKCISTLITMKALKHLQLDEMMLSWEGGLKLLGKLKGQLESFTCKNGLIAPADLEKLKTALPDARIEYSKADEKYIEKMKRLAAKKR